MLPLYVCMWLSRKLVRLTTPAGTRKSVASKVYLLAYLSASSKQCQKMMSLSWRMSGSELRWVQFCCSHVYSLDVYRSQGCIALLTYHLWPVSAYVVTLQHLPVIFNLLTVTGALVLGSVVKTVPFVVFGTYISWFYLRFFQSKPETSLQ